MDSFRRRGVCFLLGILGALGCLSQPLVVHSQTAAAEACPEKFQILPKGLKPLINTVAFVSEAILRSPKNQLTSAASPDLDEQKQSHDGQHDFDWQLGTWKIHMHRLQHPLTGSTTWTDLDGTVTVRKIWDGRANLAEIVADGPSGHLEFLSLRLYDPAAQQWSLNFANTKGGTLGVPLYGEFKDGRGEFYDQETYNGRMIMVRFVFSRLSSDSTRDEQSFSADGGKTWQVNWVNTQTRVKDEPDKEQ
ncbi:MAG: hypothetical protein WA690_25630 [Candidatus Acidiferrales bacterium]